jgi:hypothetical protein
MQTTIDDCQQYIISTLREGLKKFRLNFTVLHWSSYDVYLAHAVQQFMNSNHLLDPDNIRDVVGITDCQETMEMRRVKDVLTSQFSDALWILCRRGILRPGENQANSSPGTVRALIEGYAVTEYGKQWLETHCDDDLLPANPDRLSMLFSNFQSMFGKSYFRRAKEAVSCFFSGNYLACCVMCGAATEAILLSAGFAKDDRNKILRLYKATGGRRKLEKNVFGQSSQFIQERYQKYTDLISFWRDESGHGDESEIDVNEAYIAMLTLLRCAEFMRDHWGEITA